MTGLAKAQGLQGIVHE